MEEKLGRSIERGKRGFLCQYHLLIEQPWEKERGCVLEKDCSSGNPQPSPMTTGSMEVWLSGVAPSADEKGEQVTTSDEALGRLCRVVDRRGWLRKLWTIWVIIVGFPSLVGLILRLNGLMGHISRVDFSVDLRLRSLDDLEELDV
ncbi:hypothetical protein L2E82_15537 [Cichorium intybus]|uniref:Uncharacterized protein n=1 Tax=Cichorium intybus TaxID=13427 RepID=A0ACB9F3H2_CICIN|nr:hypothetical protein L2E82_15537 [Cichorium intybus]